MSLRSSLWRYLGLLAVAALAVGALAGPASAKKMSAKQRAAVRAQLKKQVKKNPKVINRKSFIKRASLVNFKLPVTISLRGVNGVNPATGKSTNPNNATVDLGASLGSREVNLGGSLSAEIVFHDSYDGGALGNVDLNILESSKHTLTSTSIPLLWNTQVSNGSYAANSLGAGTSGCGDFVGDNALPFGPFPGFPYFASPADAQAFAISQAAGTPDLTKIGGFLPDKPGVDSIDKVVADKKPGNDNIIGGNPQPFPYGASVQPGEANYVPTARDTVLRTNALALGIAHPGTEVAGGGASANPDGVNGSQNIRLGKSGGQANLFGNIPGKGYGIDVTVNLKTRINSILRVVDQDSFGSPLISNASHYPAGIFNCRQIWTGGIDNYIPSVHLTGDLKIAPGITSDGHLRIAKATVATSGDDAGFAVAACLAPWGGVAPPQASGPNSDTDEFKIPASAGPPPTVVADSALPSNPLGTQRPVPSNVNCNAAPTALVRDSALGAASVQQLSGANNLTDGYTVSNSGSSVSVGAGLHVNAVSLDVLIGDI